MDRQQQASHTLRLPEILDLTCAAPLAESFRALRGVELAVDAAGVQRVGAQCAQVIMSAVATWKADEVRHERQRTTGQQLLHHGDVAC